MSRKGFNRCLVSEGRYFLSAHPDTSEMYNLIIYVFFPQQVLNRLHAPHLWLESAGEGIWGRCPFISLEPPHKPWLGGWMDGWVGGPTQRTEAQKSTQGKEHKPRAYLLQQRGEGGDRHTHTQRIGSKNETDRQKVRKMRQENRKRPANKRWRPRAGAGWPWGGKGDGESRWQREEASGTPRQDQNSAPSKASRSERNPEPHAHPRLGPAGQGSASHLGFPAALGAEDAGSPAASRPTAEPPGWELGARALGGGATPSRLTPPPGRGLWPRPASGARGPSGRDVADGWTCPVGRKMDPFPRHYWPIPGLQVHVRALAARRGPAVRGAQLRSPGPLSQLPWPSPGASQLRVWRSVQAPVAPRCVQPAHLWMWRLARAETSLALCLATSLLGLWDPGQSQEVSPGPPPAPRPAADLPRGAQRPIRALDFPSSSRLNSHASCVFVLTRESPRFHWSWPSASLPSLATSVVKW